MVSALQPGFPAGPRRRSMYSIPRRECTYCPLCRENSPPKCRGAATRERLNRFPVDHVRWCRSGLLQAYGIGPRGAPRPNHGAPFYDRKDCACRIARFCRANSKWPASLEEAQEPREIGIVALLAQVFGSGLSSLTPQAVNSVAGSKGGGYPNSNEHRS